MALAFGNTKGKAIKNSHEAYTYKDGENTVRLVGGILPRYVYWVKGTNNKDIPIECLAFSREKEKFDNLEVDFVQSYFPDKKCSWSYSINCIDPTDGKVKVLNLKKKLFEQIMAAADQIAALIDGADADGGVAIGQQGQIGGRDLNAPGTVWQGQADVNLAIQRHGDDGTERQIGAVAGDRQRLQTFGQVEFVIPCDHGDGKPTEVGIDGHVIAGVGRVTCSVVDGGGNGGLAVGQQCQVGRRYAGAPGTISQHGGGVGFAVQGDGDGLARFHMGGGTGQGLSSFHLRAVDNVVTGEHVDAERR